MWVWPNGSCLIGFVAHSLTKGVFLFIIIKLKAFAQNVECEKQECM